MGGTNPALPRNIGQIIKDVKIMTGSGQKLEFLEEYDIELQIRDDEEPEYVWGNQKEILEGAAAVELGVTCFSSDNPSNTLQNIQRCEEDDRKISSATSRRYCIQFKSSGVMMNEILYPLSHAGLRIEIVLNNLERLGTSHVGGGVANSLEVTDVKLTLTNVKLDSKYIEGFNARYRDAGVPYHYRTYEANTHTPGGRTGNRLRLSENVSSLIAVKSVQIKTSRLSDASKESQVRTSGGLLDFQFKAGGTYMPKQPVICGSSDVVDDDDLERGTIAFWEYMRTIGKMNNMGPSEASKGVFINRDEWYSGAVGTDNTGGSKFVIAQTFSKSPEVDLVSGTKTKNSPLDLILNYKSSKSTPTDLTVYSFLYKDAVATLSALGDLVEE